VETSLDVTLAAGGSLRPLVREYPGVQVTDTLLLELRGEAGRLPPILSGIEVALDKD
jgi:hypothetical protein